MSLQGIGLVTVKGEPLTPYPSAWARHQANACERLTCTYCQQSRLNASLQSGARVLPVVVRPKQAKPKKGQYLVPARFMTELTRRKV